MANKQISRNWNANNALLLDWWLDANKFRHANGLVQQTRKMTINTEKEMRSPLVVI
jgi:hypothetical protein